TINLFYKVNGDKYVKSFLIYSCNFNVILIYFVWIKNIILICNKTSCIEIEPFYKIIFLYVTFIVKYTSLNQAFHLSNVLLI
ncbi:hypothetical protein CRN61_08710, partial [Vibrio vulnificus]